PDQVLGRVYATGKVHQREIQVLVALALRLVAHAPERCLVVRLDLDPDAHLLKTCLDDLRRCSPYRVVHDRKRQSEVTDAGLGKQGGSFVIVRPFNQVLRPREPGSRLDDTGRAYGQVVIDTGQDLVHVDAILHGLPNSQALQARTERVDGEPLIARRLRLDDG